MGALLLAAVLLLASMPACQNISASGLRIRRPARTSRSSSRRGRSNFKNRAAEECGEACVEGAAEGCTDAACHEATFLFFTEFFRDSNWRYTQFPYDNDPDGFYVRTSGGRDTGTQVHGSYIFVQRPQGDPPMYGMTGSLALSLPSGFTLTGSYLFAEENIDDPGYLHYNYFRIGGGHLLARDLNAWISLGVNFVFLDAEIGDGSGYDVEDEDTVGTGAELAIVHFIRKPTALSLTIAPAVTFNGTLTDIEAAVGTFSGPVQLSAGYRSLYWPGGNISGPFISLGLWF